jgi:hypothetical protein
VTLSTVAARPSGSGSQTPSSSTSSRATGTGFDAPEPDIASLFRLFMAANADVLGDDKGAAWEHYLLFRVPPDIPGAPDNPATRRLSPECLGLMTQLRNEITAETLLNAARADFKQALVAAQSAPRTGVFKLRTREQLAAYDSSKNAFRLDPITSAMLARDPKFLVGRQANSELLTDYRSGSARSWCNVRVGSNPTWLQPSIWGGLSGFELEIQGNESLAAAVPMDRGVAEAYLNVNPARTVDLEVVVDVGPAPLKKTTRAGGGSAMPARIIAARLLNPSDRRVLHTFNVVAPARSTTESATETTGGAVLFTANRGLLLTVRDHSARLTEDALLQATRRQVTAEQMLWRLVDSMRNPNNPAGIHASRWNPKRAVFSYEWQTVIERQPDVARGPLLDMFLRPDPDWSLVTRDPAWDTRFEALVVTTLFAREKVDGRDPSFAAQELVPVYRRHLELAASKAPTNLWFPMTLPPYTYDFALRAIRFAAETNRRGKPSTIGGTDIVQLAAEDDAPGLPQYVVPPAARNLATYPVSGFLSLMQRAEPPPTNPGLKLGAEDATHAWRHVFAIGSSYRAVPMVEVLALDRRVQITSLPMEPAVAEGLAKRTVSNPNSRLTARVYFNADHVEIGERVFARERSPSAVLVGKVEKIEVLDFDNAVIAVVAAAALPAPAIVTAPSLPTGPPPAPAAATPRRPSAAETEAEVQRQNAENSRKVSEALNRATAEKIKQAMAAIEKENKCRAEAAKVNKEPQSKAYKDAYAACQAAR